MDLTNWSDAWLVRLIVGILQILAVSVPSHVEVHIKLKSVIFVTSERYLSVGFSPFKAVSKDGQLTFSSPKVHTLASALAPCYLRMGGTDADFLIFKPDANKTTYDGDWPIDHKYENFTMSGKDWDTVNSFVRSVGWRLVFDFNVLLRDGKDNWDDTNARSLLKYSFQKGYCDNLDYQLGNEPNAFRHAVNRSLSARQLAHDFVHLRRLVRKHQSLRQDNDASGDMFKSRLIGPDITRPKHVGYTLREDSVTFLKRFLSSADHAVDVISWHQYYFSGATANLSSFLNAETMDVLADQIQAVKGVINKTGYQNTTMWLSETSTATGGGAPGLSDRYVAGFLWLDKLGTAARGGSHVVVRQTFYGGSYSLIDSNLDPLPDYWLSLLYKTLVGTKVLSVTTSDKSRKLRVYAHCTASKRTEYQAGSVTVYALNVHRRTMKIDLQPAALQAGEKFQYLLTPHGKDDLKSSTVALNGEPLRLIDDHTLPQLTPVTVPPHQPLTLPANTFGFWVFPAAEAKACV